jgi:hypothetical protein
MRCRVGTFTFFAVAVAACAAGQLTQSDDPGSSPDSGAADGAAPGPDGGPATTGDSGATGPGPDAGPTVFDGGQPAKIGDDGGGSDAPSDAPADAPPDSAVAPVDAAPDAPISCGTPGGSYTVTCVNCTFVGTTLSCSCQNDSQVLGPTSLNICSCSQPVVITNTNGVLVCS